LLAGVCPVTGADDGDAIAIVNGQPIGKRRLVETLMESHGLSVLQQLMALELAKGETVRLKVPVNAADVEREYGRALAKIAPDVDELGKPLSDEERQKSLDNMLQQKGVTMSEFRLAMERNAHLRKAVEHGFQITEPTLREEFARLYGEKVEVRHIQIGDVNGLHEALNRLDKGEDFAAVTKLVSQNAESAASGGLLAPFAFNDENIAPVLREAAFSMKPGEVSKPIRVTRWWHILKLERRIPATEVRFEDVHEKVEQALRDRVIPQEMNKLLAALYQKAQIRVLDSNLKQKYDKLVKNNAGLETNTGP
jgi:parvulin-like peptidyl-prolyl isomerase